jgi:hypothetical protein
MVVYRLFEPLTMRMYLFAIAMTMSMFEPAHTVTHTAYQSEIQATHCHTGQFENDHRIQTLSDYILQLCGGSVLDLQSPSCVDCIRSINHPTNQASKQASKLLDGLMVGIGDILL